jgi:hypothetical protein
MTGFTIYINRENFYSISFNSVGTTTGLLILVENLLFSGYMKEIRGYSGYSGSISAQNDLLYRSFRNSRSTITSPTETTNMIHYFKLSGPNNDGTNYFFQDLSNFAYNYIQLNSMSSSNI